jgi:bifunctional non-homologous end joining protein LigD
VDGDESFDEALRKGRIVFTLDGKKLKGGWALIRTSGRRWLLMKRKDRYASSAVDITTAKPRSVTTRRLLASIARDEGGDVAKAATGDPQD